MGEGEVLLPISGKDVVLTQTTNVFSAIHPVSRQDVVLRQTTVVFSVTA